jgi:hypothetical protein
MESCSVRVADILEFSSGVTLTDVVRGCCEKYLLEIIGGFCAFSISTEALLSMAPDGFRLFKKILVSLNISLG